MVRLAYEMGELSILISIGRVTNGYASSSRDLIIFKELNAASRWWSKFPIKIPSQNLPVRGQLVMPRQVGQQ